MFLLSQKLKSTLGRLRENRASTAVEFAILLFPLLLFLFGVIELGRLFAVDHELNRTLNHLSRTAIVVLNSLGQIQCGNIDSFLENATNILKESLEGRTFVIKETDLIISFVAKCTSGVPELSVNIAYQFEWNFPLAEGKNIMLQGDSLTVLSDF